MKKIIISSLLLLTLSCSNIPFFNNNNQSEDDKKPERTYIDLQIKLHSAYSIFKALNAGIITQEDYDMLKKEIFE